MSGRVTAKYTCVALEGELLEPKSEGKSPSVMVKLRCVEGKNTGKDLTYFGSLHDNAVKYTIEALRAMGWTGSDVTDLVGLGSTKFTAVEKENTYEGKTTRRIQGIWPIKAKNTMDAKKAKTFAKKFKTIAAAVKPLEVDDANKAPAEIPPSNLDEDAAGFPPSDADENSANPFAD